MDPLTSVRELFEDSIDTKRRAARSCPETIVGAATLMIDALEGGGKVLACGNGGSAADAQHLSSELVNRFEIARRALPAVALTTDASTVTSIANDDSYASVFSRQVEALGRAGDVLVAFTTSGNSENVVRAVATAHERAMKVIAVTGGDGGAVGAALGDGDVEVRVPSNRTARIQEVHLLALHCVCHLVERHFAPQTSGGTTP